VDIESRIKPGNGIEYPECLEPWDVGAAPIVPSLILPTRISKMEAEKVFGTVNAMKRRRNMRVKKM
jgi:hypothetical protein